MRKDEHQLPACAVSRLRALVINHFAALPCSQSRMRRVQAVARQLRQKPLRHFVDNEIRLHASYVMPIKIARPYEFDLRDRLRKHPRQ